MKSLVFCCSGINERLGNAQALMRHCTKKFPYGLCDRQSGIESDARELSNGAGDVAARRYHAPRMVSLVARLAWNNSHGVKPYCEREALRERGGLTESWSGRMSMLEMQNTSEN